MYEEGSSIGKMDSSNAAHFQLSLELEQLQAKVRLLAGGTDGEQLAEVLLDREEELRMKDGQISQLTSALLDFESDRNEYEVFLLEIPLNYNLIFVTFNQACQGF